MDCEQISDWRDHRDAGYIEPFRLQGEGDSRFVAVVAFEAPDEPPKGSPLVFVPPKGSAAGQTGIAGPPVRHDRVQGPLYPRLQGYADLSGGTGPKTGCDRRRRCNNAYSRFKIPAPCFSASLTMHSAAATIRRSAFLTERTKGLSNKQRTGPLPSIPQPLVQAMKDQRCIVFLGAGASKEARNATGQAPPDAIALRNLLAERFLDEDAQDQTLATVAEYAISASAGRGIVFETIKNALEPFQPGDGHKLLPQFRWRMIASTNYDTLIEQAYQQVPDRLQTPVPFVKDSEPVDEKLRVVDNGVEYLKLHGCINSIHDPEAEPILSNEAYASPEQNRTRLFSRLEDKAFESSIIFIGYRLDDMHIRKLVYNPRIKRTRPPWYIITPSVKDYQRHHWERLGVQIIAARFGDFMRALDTEIGPLFRSLIVSSDIVEFPLRKHYCVNAHETQRLRHAFAKDLALIHSGMAVAYQDPQKFFEGYDTGFGAVTQRLVVSRKVEEELLLRAVLENEHSREPQLFLLRGMAGAGKTIILKRVAFEAATGFDSIVLWSNEDGALEPSWFDELYGYVQKPIYLFVDEIALRAERVRRLLREANEKSIPLRVIAAERNADWNTYCGALENEFPPFIYRVTNLSLSEVEDLLEILARHDCLGHLKQLDPQSQINAFMEKERADRQLLVALYELTQGKPFEEIVVREHSRIFPDEAQQLYLDIATLHQFGVKIRAGTIARISGITFTDFDKRLFTPLEKIIVVTNDAYTKDYQYQTRHRHVARIVFREICNSDEKKAEQFLRILDALDIGYSVDAHALRAIAHGRTIEEAFSGVDAARSIFEKAAAIDKSDEYIRQQWAIFEHMHDHGSLKLASELIEEAIDKAPEKKAIRHTQAEIYRKQANAADSALMRDTLRRRARETLRELPARDAFAQATGCKLLVDEIRDLMHSDGAELSEHKSRIVEERIGETETRLAKAQQQHPDDPEIIRIEANFRTLLKESEKALQALEKAWRAGLRGSGTAIRLSRIYNQKNLPKKATQVLREALERNNEDKATHHALGMHYLAQGEYEISHVKDHLLRGFAKGDGSFEARFDFARFLFLIGDLPAAEEMFQEIDRKAPSGFREKASRKNDEFSDKMARCNGTVSEKYQAHVQIQSSAYHKRIFGPRRMSNVDVFDDISVGNQVSFCIRFSRRGPVAIDILAQ